MNRITLSFLLLLGSSVLFGQHTHKCATDEFTEKLITNDADYLKRYNEAQDILHQIAESKQKSEAVVFTIPVVVHVMYNDYRDNISRAQIEDGLRVLNEDFRRMNADASNTRTVFQSRASDPEIEFKLAKIDPSGNCTDGITRTQTALSVDASDVVKTLSNWDNSKYLNIWVVNSIANNSGVAGIILGYAYFPVSGGQNFSRDGMVIRHDQMGTIGTALTTTDVSNANVHKGRTITHEAGHYLGLPHTFSQGCFGGDGISDTPPVSASNSGCDFTTNTCTNDSPDLPDMIENYMDYSNGSCQNMFTAGQTAVMRASLSSTQLRQNLRSSTNLTATGVTNPPDCLPTAGLEVDKQLICTGESVNFFDSSEDGDPSTWAWTFPGGTPSTSNQKNPVITYNTSGVFDVTLTVSNGAGSDNVTYAREISVKNPGSPAFHADWSENFEATNISNEISLIDAGDGIKFDLFTQAGSSGSNSLKLDNFNATVIGEQDWLISPAISTIFSSGLSVSFDYAFAAKDNANNDELNVYASIDCGETWILRRFYRGAQLRTAAITTQNFTPSGPTEWTTQSIGFDAYIGPDPLLIRFEFINGGGNNFYIDNIQFNGTIGLDEYQTATLNIYPNPASTQVTISADDFDLKNVTLSLTDLSGRVIVNQIIDTEEKEYQMNLDDYSLSPGVYLIHLNNGTEQAVERLIVE